MPERDIYTVQRLNREVKQLLDGALPMLWVQGELSNIARPASGHLYFTLKDARAQVRCAMFRSRCALLDFRPEHGNQVLLRARAGLYEGRGEFQLIVESLEVAGDGRLQRAFEQLKQHLQRQGLFATKHKQALPERPQRIGVITSATGAALRDVLSVLNRRNPRIEVLVYPVPVQGEQAATAIARMLAVAEQRAEVDALILTRGGGSLEDLWAFNEEVVARAIHCCSLPVVSAVGHETDVTIADFVADVRAPTPSAAAELLSPDQQVIVERLHQARQRLQQHMQRRLVQAGQQLDWLRRRLREPSRRVQELAQRSDDLQLRLQSVMRHRLQDKAAQLQALSSRLHLSNPAQRLSQLQSLNRQLDTRLQQAMQVRLAYRREHWQGLARALHAVSPLATLERGFAIITSDSDERVIRNSQQLKPGDQVRARLGQGSAALTVNEVNHESHY